MKIIDYEKAGVFEFYQNLAKIVSRTAEDWPGYKEIAEKIMKKMNSVCRSEKPMENGFNVITHGDTFMNNILFRHDRHGKPIDVRLVSMIDHKITTSFVSYFNFNRMNS